MLPNLKGRRITSGQKASPTIVELILIRSVVVGHDFLEGRQS
jgi:hypothetical protein